MVSLSPTARVLLGMLRIGRRTGYEIKQLAEVSARFFWSISYGQIYPELRRLEEADLVSGESSPKGGRQRRAYSLTAAGERALDDWLRSAEPLTFEVRDEGMLKLFFSDALSVGERTALFAAMRARHEDIVARLESIEELAGSKGSGPHLTLQLGLGLHRAMVELCDQLAADAARR